MDTLNRLIRKAPPTESTLPMHFPPGYAHEQRSHVAPASAELQPSFEPVSMGAVTPSQNRSALPLGEASKVGRILLHQLQSPEWDDTSHVEGRGAPKVRLVRRSDPSQALELGELQIQIDAQQELLSAFKQQLEEAGTREAKWQDAQKAAKEEAERHLANTLRAAETIRQAEEAHKAAEEATRQAEERVRIAMEAKCQAEERAARIEAAAQKELAAILAKANEEFEARQKQLEALEERMAQDALKVREKANEEFEARHKKLEALEERMAQDALKVREKAEEETRKAMEVSRQAEERAANIEKAAQTKLAAVLAKSNEESEARQKQVKALEERALMARERERAEGQEERSPNMKQAARKKMASMEKTNEEFEELEEEVVEKAFLARARENKLGKRKEMVAGTSEDKEEKSSVSDVEMNDLDSDEEIESILQPTSERMVVDKPDTLMPGALDLDDSITVPGNAGDRTDSRSTEQDIGPRKSWQRMYGTAKAANTYTSVRDAYVPPIPKPAREKRPIGGDGPKLKATRLQLPSAARPGERQMPVAPTSGGSRKSSLPPPVSSRPQPTPTARPREHQASAAPPSRSGPKPSLPPVSRTQERETSAATRASTSSFEEKSLAILGSLQLQVDFLMKNAKPKQKGHWQRPSQFKVAPNRTRDTERTAINNWVRKVMNELLLIEHDKDILEFTDIFEPQSSQALEMAQYEMDKSGEGPCLKPMIPNLTQLGGKWNNELWIMFRDHCIDIRKLDDDNEDEVREVFHNRLARLKYFLKAHKPKPGETDQDLEKRMQRTSKSKLARQRQHNRRNTLFKTRMDICAAHLPSEDCTNPTANEEAYSRVYDVIERLGAEGMSSDESDEDSNGMTTFTAKKTVWRARWVTDILLGLDKDYNRTNMFGNQKSGNPARHRGRRNGRTSVRNPPGKKPGNFYDEVWYRNLNAGEKRDLDVASDEEVFEIEEDD